MGDPKITNVQNTVQNDTNKPADNAGKIYSSYLKRQNIIDAAKSDNKDTTIWDDSENKAFNYVNSGSYQEAAVAYRCTFDASYKNENNELGNERLAAIGQVQNEGNDVPIGNTFTAFLLNNNKGSTATIGNTTPQELARNFFTTADNIQEVIAPHLQGENGQLIATNIDGSGKTKLIEPFKQTYTNGNGVLNQAEIDDTAIAYAKEAKATTLKESKNSDEQKRDSAASTVNINKNDPYYEFFVKVAKLDGNEGVSETELAMAIEKISEKKGDGLYFNKENLSKFMSMSEEDLKAEFKQKSANADGTDSKLEP